MKIDKHVPTCFGDSRVETVPIFKVFCQYWQKFNYVYVWPVGKMMVKK